MPKIEDLAQSLGELAKPEMSPKALFKAVQKRHPKATKKDIRRAAFYSVILAAEQNSDQVTHLHDIALRSANEVDDMNGKDG